MCDASHIRSYNKTRRSDSLISMIPLRTPGEVFTGHPSRVFVKIHEFTRVTFNFVLEIQVTLYNSWHLPLVCKLFSPIQHTKTSDTVFSLEVFYSTHRYNLFRSTLRRKNSFTSKCSFRCTIDQWWHSETCYFVKETTVDR